MLTFFYPCPARGEAPAVHALMVEVGRKVDDGPPEGATGAALLCYTPARDMRCARPVSTLAPLEWTAQDDAPLDPELARRALDDDAVVVVQITHFTD